MSRRAPLREGPGDPVATAANGVVTITNVAFSDTPAANGNGATTGPIVATAPPIVGRRHERLPMPGNFGASPLGAYGPPGRARPRSTRAVSSAATSRH